MYTPRRSPTTYPPAVIPRDARARDERASIASPFAGDATGDVVATSRPLARRYTTTGAAVAVAVAAAAVATPPTSTRDAVPDKNRRVVATQQISFGLDATVTRLARGIRADQLRSFDPFSPARSFVGMFSVKPCGMAMEG